MKILMEHRWILQKDSGIYSLTNLPKSGMIDTGKNRSIPQRGSVSGAAYAVAGKQRQRGNAGKRKEDIPWQDPYSENSSVSLPGENPMEKESAS